MSSRSKEKALNAIRKLFKGNSNTNNNNNNNNSNNNNNNNNNNTNNNGNGNNNNNGDKIATTTSAEAAAAANEANANLPTTPATATAAGQTAQTTNDAAATAATAAATSTAAAAGAAAAGAGAIALCNGNGNAGAGGGGGGGGVAAAAATATATTAQSPNSSSQCVSVSDASPGKRMRRQDNKVSPATSKMLLMPGNNNNNNNNHNNNNNNHHQQLHQQQHQQHHHHHHTHQQLPHPPDFSIRARRLMKEYKEIQKIHNSKKEPIFTVELINDSLYEWHARLHIVDPDSKLAKDMIELNIPYILLHLVFPDNFPFAPPFMRVVQPRIEKGFVMEGGAICMELLTPRGWASAYTVEAVLMQFAASLVKGQGRIVRKPKSSKEFSRRSAEEAFRSLVKTHEKYGWVTPALSDG